MQTAKRQGRRFGFPSAFDPATGDRLLELRRTRTLAAIARILNAEGHTTATGAAWSVNTVVKVWQRLIATRRLNTGPAHRAAMLTTLQRAISHIPE